MTPSQIQNQNNEINQFQGEAKKMLKFVEVISNLNLEKEIQGNHLQDGRQLRCLAILA